MDQIEAGCELIACGVRTWVWSSSARVGGSLPGDTAAAMACTTSLILVVRRDGAADVDALPAECRHISVSSAIPSPYVSATQPVSCTPGFEKDLWCLVQETAGPRLRVCAGTSCKCMNFICGLCKQMVLSYDSTKLHLTFTISSTVGIALGSVFSIVISIRTTGTTR